jgi:hypothetical protein
MEQPDVRTYACTELVRSAPADIDNVHIERRCLATFNFALTPRNRITIIRLQALVEGKT